MAMVPVVLVLLFAVGVLFAHDRLTRKPCPACREEVPRAAKKCGHCGEALA